MALHCPATLLVAAPPRDAGAAAALVDALVGDRVLAVVCAPGEVAGQQLAQLIDVPLETEPGLLEGPPTSPVLGEIADLHRGETVLVLALGTTAGETPFARLEVS